MKKVIIILSFVFTTFMSCNDISDLNIDPDKSPTANPEQVLTSSMAYMGWVIEGQYNPYSFLWAQYLTWGPGVALGNQERFIADATEFDNMWNRTYASALSDLDFVANSESEGHAGVAKILTAYIYQGLVDNFGDVPFSEALSGTPDKGAKFSPKFDSGADVYAALIPMIDDGLADLEDVGPEDVVYNGSAAAWTKFANSLKLRILMRQANVNPGIAQQVRDLVAAGNFIENVSEMGAIPFSGDAGNENPMFARFEAGVANFYIASNSSLTILDEAGDPRKNAIYAPTVADPAVTKGIDQGSIDNEPFTASVNQYSQSTPLLYANDNDAIMISPWEVWFLRAEAAARYGTADDEVAAFTAALESHFAYVGADGSSYIPSLNYSAGLSLEEKLTLIGVQKWISFNGLQENEGWIEARRFDTPTNRMFTAAGTGIWKQPTKSALAGSNFPASWLIPQTEVSFNPNAPAQKSILDRVFWDN